MIYGIKCIGRFILWLVFLGFFFGFFFFFWNNVCVDDDFKWCYTKENKNLMAIGFFFGNFENLALMSVQILQHEINFDDRMKTRLF